MLNAISTIKASLGIEPNGRVQKAFTNTCRNHMDKYIPKDTAMLRENITVNIDNIVYKSPYAHAQYIGIVNGSEVRNYTTPGTGPYWDKRMVSAEINDVVNEVKRYMGG